MGVALNSIGAAAPVGGDRRRSGVLSRAARYVIDLAEDVNPWALVVPVALVIATLGVLGTIENQTTSISNMDREWRVDALWSWLVLSVAGALYLAGHSLGTPRANAWLALGAFLWFMALDELVVIHERLEGLAGVDWQVLYLPIVVGGGIAALMVLRELYTLHRASALLFAGGIACWVTSQALEDIQWGENDQVLVHPGLVPPEEVLEMTGSCLFGFAALLAIRAVLARRVH